MNPQEAEALAALLGMPGFEILKRELQEVDKNLGLSVRSENHPGAALIKLRIWQAFNRVAEIIMSRPEEAQILISGLDDEATRQEDLYADPAFGQF